MIKIKNAWVFLRVVISGRGKVTGAQTSTEGGYIIACYTYVKKPILILKRNHLFFIQVTIFDIWKGLGIGMKPQLWQEFNNGIILLNTLISLHPDYCTVVHAPPLLLSCWLRFFFGRSKKTQRRWPFTAHPFQSSWYCQKQSFLLIKVFFLLSNTCLHSQENKKENPLQPPHFCRHIFYSTGNQP